MPRNVEPSENRLLMQLWSGEHSLLWPLDDQSNEFLLAAERVDPGTVLSEHGAISIGGGVPALYLLSERFVLERLAVVSADESPIRLRAEPRKRFDRRLVRLPLYRLLADETGPVEARIRPAGELAADWAGAALKRVTFGEPLDVSLLVATNDDEPLPRFEPLSHFTAGQISAMPDVRIDHLAGQQLSGTTHLLEVRSVRRRVAVPASFVAALGRIDGHGDTAEWWGRSLTTLAFDAVRFRAARGGVLDLVAGAPWSARQQRSARAIRLILALLRLPDRGAARFVDHCYRRQSTISALRSVYTFASRAGRAAIRTGVGDRRFERFAQPFHPAAVRQTASLGDIVADAALEVAESLAARARRSGDALPVDLDRVVRAEFMDPRASASIAAFRRDVDSGTLVAALEAASLSRLRRSLRAFPRNVLVDAAIGDSAAVRKRISAIYSRHGRRLFFEDLEARERHVKRDGLFDYAAIIDARNRVRALARRMAL